MANEINRTAVVGQNEMNKAREWMAERPGPDLLEKDQPNFAENTCGNVEIYNSHKQVFIVLDTIAYRYIILVFHCKGIGSGFTRAHLEMV